MVEVLCTTGHERVTSIDAAPGRINHHVSTFAHHVFKRAKCRLFGGQVDIAFCDTWQAIPCELQQKDMFCFAAEWKGQRMLFLWRLMHPHLRSIACPDRAALETGSFNVTCEIARYTATVLY